MRITKAEFFEMAIPLVKPFVIATGTERTYNGILLRLETDDGTVGWGEAAPSKRVTGETPEDVARELGAAIPKLEALDPLQTHCSIQKASKFIRGSSALAALDIALHDLKGHHYGIPVRHLLGGSRSSVETSVTITIRDGNETLRQAEELISQGVRILKLKIGSGPDDDIARIRKLRTWLGSGIRLRVDANQGYTASEGLRVLRAIYQCDIEFCEQPVPACELKALARVRRSSPIPIMADESATSPEALLRIIREKAADMVNLKLMKAGGILGAFRMAEIAAAAGMPCQMGCFLETRLGITAATHLACAHSNIVYADLDGHLELADDPTKGGVVTREGVNHLAEGAGLGVSVPGRERTRKRKA
jgi:L-alanine-DL-glutamate epimerase-like enolase superfamily enzyme